MQGTTIPARLALAVALVALAVPATSRADGASDEARAAYDRGSAAHARGDYRAAASEMAHADTLAPNAVALKAALDEALLADDPELGMQLVERAHLRAAGDTALAPSVRDATARFAGRTGRVRIDCGAASCRASIDARAVDLPSLAIVLVGPHRVTIEVGGTVSTQDVVVAGDHEVDVVVPSTVLPRALAPVPPLAVPPRAETSSAKGVSPVWFVTAAAMTAVLGGATIGSGIDTANQHSAFASHGCAAAGAPPNCGALGSNGAGAQTRTNVLGAVTGALGVTALALAFVVRF